MTELAESVTEKTKSIARFKTEAEDVKSDHISTGKRLELTVEESCWRYMMRRGPDGVPVGMVNPCWRAQRVAVSSGSCKLYEMHLERLGSVTPHLSIPVVTKVIRKNDDRESGDARSQPCTEQGRPLPRQGHR